MPQVNGVVAAMSDKFDFAICVDEVWYKSKFEIPCSRGDTVTFDSGDPGKKWCRGLKVVAAGSTPAPTGGAAKAPYVPKAGFPVAHDTKDRSIIRQNSLSHATKLYVDMAVTSDATETDAKKVVELARIFEAYSSGDADWKEAEAELKGL